MHATPVIAASALSVLLVFTAGMARSVAGSPMSIAPAASVAEVIRIRAHFDSVLAELHADDVAQLTPAQLAGRSALLLTLSAYRDAGSFPRNRDFPGEAVPYFVDRETGVLCAVAHLLESTGRRDIVDRVAAMDNNIYVAELAGDAPFRDWLDVNGLTLADAARIQVPYIGDGPGDPSPSVSANGGGVTLSSAALAGAFGVTLWNARSNHAGRSKVGNALGFATGLAALGAGAGALGDSGAGTTIGAASIAAGAASLWLATRGVLRHRSESAERSRYNATLTPTMPASGSAGVSLNVRF